MKSFYAKFGHGESEGIDTFEVIWSIGCGYFYSSVGLIKKVVRRVERMDAKVFLLVPDWPGCVYC